MDWITKQYKQELKDIKKKVINKRQFTYHKRFLNWIKLNEENLTIKNLGKINGKYCLEFEEPTKFIWIHDMDVMFDKYPIHNQNNKEDGKE